MTYTRGELKTIIRQRCDLENAAFENDSELEQHINDATAVLHDLLISCAGSQYALKTASFQTTPNVANYALSSSDFYRLVRVSLVFDDLDYPIAGFNQEGLIKKNIQTAWGPGYLPRYNINLGSNGVWGIEFEPPPDKIATVNLMYHNTPPVYTSDNDPINIPFPDYIVMESCIRVKDKEERETLRFERERMAIQKRIEDWGATFDQANAPRTVEAPSRYSRAIWRRERVF